MPKQQNRVLLIRFALIICYDLRGQVNGRGTFMCSQKCIPFLQKSSNGHILNISPPLTMETKWFQNHVGYTMYAAPTYLPTCALSLYFSVSPFILRELRFAYEQA